MGPEKRKGRPGHLAKMSVTARPLPPSQLPKAHAILGAGGGANLTMPSEHATMHQRLAFC